jgi:hypothetical protein
MHSYFCSLVILPYPTDVKATKPPLFAGAANASNTVDLLSDSSDEEDLRAVSTFARRPADDDEGEVQLMKMKMTKKPVSQMKNMPPPFSASVSAEDKATCSLVGVAANSKSTAVEKVSKS